ncbi:MAG: NAD(+) synthase [Bacillota bacterium]|nr:NAD(+) synthase [Eubacteriales bacterium]MDI9492359.1 NAD(+) synthase [Bacillota bacterium]HPF18090.1 NAD(+) synthase [Bacillota bacterium]
MQRMGFIRVAAVSPRVRLADPRENAAEMIRQAQLANEQGASVVLFPELSLSGYSCGDLFFSARLREAVTEGLAALTEGTKHLDCTLIIGFPLLERNNLYNCAAVLQNGHIRGIVPKMHIPNTGEFNENRWFCSGRSLSAQSDRIRLNGEDVPFGHLLFRDEDSGFSFGIEVCHDAWMPVTPGARLILAGATTLFNPSASTDFAGKSAVRTALVKDLSFRYQSGYVYASAGPSESTADTVFSGHCVIAQAGDVLRQTSGLSRDSVCILADIDYEGIQTARTCEQNFDPGADLCAAPPAFRTVFLHPLRCLTRSDRLLCPCSKTPFMPDDTEEAAAYCREIFSIQATALAERLRRARVRTAVIGVSGGSDSALALLAAKKAMELNGQPPEDILAVAMDGFGTTGHTKNNADRLMEQLGCRVRRISIVESVLQHFKDIGHDPALTNVTYENAQARERTQILMDLANQNDGLVVGTGDLSEAALGWCTYNGDHMSMYGINAGITKGLVRHVIATVAEDMEKTVPILAVPGDPKILRETLTEILNTPISPELLPPSANGTIRQQTEDQVGPYELHDYFIFHCIKGGAAPDRVRWLAEQTFEGIYPPSEIKKWLTVFIRRFFSQQFKRNCTPDGPKLISLGLSPRGDWRMPSDASAESWLRTLQ